MLNIADRMNRFALFEKLIDRQFPNEIISISESWCYASLTCVKWVSHVFSFFSLVSGVRLGGVLSPILFSILLMILSLK